MSLLPESAYNRWLIIMIFFSLTTRSNFIKIAMVGYWKWLNLPINNEKRINLEDLSSLLLSTWISLFAPLCSHFLSLLYILCVASLISSLAFACLVYCISCFISDFVFYAFLALFLILYFMRYISHLISHPLSYCFYLSIVDLLIFLFYIISLNKQLYLELAINQYRSFVWHYWVSCTLHPCFISWVL